LARTKSVVGLDIGTHSVCAVELTGSGDNITVGGVGWERIPSPDLLEDTILAVITENNLNSRNVVTAVSGRSVIVRQVAMNAMPQDALQEAVQYEADKYIPYPVEDVYLACEQLGGVDEQNQIRVLLVASRKELVEDHLAMLKRVGITPLIIDVDPFALNNAFELCNSRGELANEGEAVALVDIGASKMSICITKSTSDCFTRELYTAGNSMTDAIAKRFGENIEDVEVMKEDPGDAVDAIREAVTPVLEDIGSEVRLSFDYYENQFDQPVSRVLLSGGAIQFPGITEALGSIFELETVRFTPFDQINVSATNDVILSEKASDMVVALGLASRIRGL
jgi:type IV pilus assembly protein PilM